LNLRGVTSAEKTGGKCTDIIEVQLVPDKATSSQPSYPKRNLWS
jgi:hypothetical protein